METHFLETFIVVAKHASIAEAARRLNLTPAAVAQRLHRLEEEFGYPLVTRVGRSVQPTTAGLAILADAHDIVERAKNLKSLAAVGEAVGQLRLGATASALTGIIPPVIARLGSTHPRLDYYIRPGASADLYQAVLSGDLDAAVIIHPPFPMPKILEFRPIRREPLVAIAAAGTPEMPIGDLVERYRFIRYDRGQWGGQVVDQFMRAQGWTPREWLELDALDAIAALVSRGLGVSIVPNWAPPWPEGLHLQKTPLLNAPKRQVDIVWRRAGVRLAGVNAFVDACGTAQD